MTKLLPKVWWLPFFGTQCSTGTFRTSHIIHIWKLYMFWHNQSVCTADNGTGIFCFSFLAHSKNELMQWRGVRRLSVRPSVRLSVNFCANHFFSQTNGRIATKLAHDGLQVSVHPGCAQGQGQRSRDTRTFLYSWNELLRHWRSGLWIQMAKNGKSDESLYGDNDVFCMMNRCDLLLLGTVQLSIQPISLQFSFYHLLLIVQCCVIQVKYFVVFLLFCTIFLQWFVSSVSYVAYLVLWLICN